MTPCLVRWDTRLVLLSGCTVPVFLQFPPPFRESCTNVRRISTGAPCRPLPGTCAAPLSPDWQSRLSSTLCWPAVSHCRAAPWRTCFFPALTWQAPGARCWCPSPGQTLTAKVIFSRLGNPTKYMHAPPVNDRNSRDARSSSLHWPSVAYSSNWFIQPSKSPLPSYFSGLNLNLFSLTHSHSSVPLLLVLVAR